MADGAHGAGRAFHFVFGLRPQTDPFHLVHYLCLESCRRVNEPAAIHFHFRHEPHGPLWERIRPQLELHRLAGPTEGFDPSRYAETLEGRLVERAGWSTAHEADFLRLRILLERGGVYADMDTLFVRPYPHALDDCEFAIGEEQPVVGADGVLKPSLCNAVFIAQPNARFARAWLSRMGEAFDGRWSSHSCQLAAALWREMPEALRIVPTRWFYRHPPTPRGLRVLLEDLDTDLRGVCSIHLWAHLWWDEWRQDFSSVHAGMLTEDYVRSVDTTYNVLARPFLP
jgi:hypothetical protein